jgi:hypothetical protein
VAKTLSATTGGGWSFQIISRFRELKNMETEHKKITDEAKARVEQAVRVWEEAKVIAGEWNAKANSAWFRSVGAREDFDAKYSGDSCTAPGASEAEIEVDRAEMWKVINACKELMEREASAKQAVDDAYEAAVAARSAYYAAHGVEEVAMELTKRQTQMM